MDHLPQRSPEALKKQMEGPRKGRTKLANLREAVNPQTVKTFNSLLPTPRASEPGSTNQGYGDNLKEGICKQIGIPTKKYPMLPTPTAMDTKKDALKHATKLLQGKTHRASGQPIQVTLSDAVMMEKIKENPELMTIYQDHQMEERPLLPKQEEFVNYLREQTTIKELTEKTTIKKTTIEHWFRRDKAGFSFPSIENWEEIKPHLKIIQFNKEMTTVKTKEWTTKSPMLPTPRSSEWKGCGQVGSKSSLDWEKKNYLSGVINETCSPQIGEPTHLNPSFVEEMMGFPIGHTDLRH
tara:strand:- start:259 stop:1143 length:885 start_codon:yes stop_codon:yes gene_type:complete